MSASSEQAAITALAMLATEWFKAVRRLLRLSHDTAPARIERERAQIAYAQTRIEDALAQNGMRLVTFDGMGYSPELPAEPVNPEDFDTNEGLAIAETLEPTVLCNGRVIARGRIILAKAN